MLSKTPVLSLLLPALVSPALSQSQMEPGVSTEARDTIQQGGIAAIMTAPLVDDTIEEGAIWVRTRTMRAHFDATGGTVYPVFGRAAAKEWPVHFDVTSVRVGDVSIDTHVEGPPALARETDVVQARAGFTEIFHLGLDGIEQTFVFDDLPGTGELVLELGVDTDLKPVVDGERLSFAHPELGSVGYGTAVVFDGSGRAAEINRVWTGNGIEFRVPAAFLADATLPVTIDPLWSSITNGFGVTDDADPAVIYAGVTNQFLVVWNEYTSAQNLDVYASRYSSSLGAPLEGILVEGTNDMWQGPAAAYSYGADRALIAAVVNPGTNGAGVYGRLLNVGAAQLDPATVQISSTGITTKTDVDVGGSNSESSHLAHFCVTWSRSQPNNEIDVEYRILEGDGVPVTSIRKVNTSAADEIQPAISQGLGDTDLSGDRWQIVWTADTDNDGRGAILTKGIYFTGTLALDTDVVSVTADQDFSNPTVSSLGNENLSGTGERGALIAFERAYTDITSPTGFQTDILVAVVSDEQVLAVSGLTTAEDFDPALQQRSPVVSTNGRSFYIAYLEEDYDSIGSGQWDVYLASGEITPSLGQVRFALAERHVMLENTDNPARGLDIVSRWEGENNSTSSRCLCVWAEDLGNPAPGFGEIHGAGYQYPFSVQSPSSAVGVQYCDANPNSVGAFGGRQASWLRISGTTQIGQLHLVQGLDIPLNSFGFLLASRQTGNQNLPGGSAGRLCLGGSVGRYDSQIVSSGVTGTLSTIINPAHIPQPMGNESAAPGESWRFQFWHRDTVGGVATSNFTNACTVRFDN